MKTIINFSHPITDEQKDQLKNMLGEDVRIIDIKTQFDHHRSFARQARDLVNQVARSVALHNDLIVNPPGLNFAALAVMTEFKRRLGRYPLYIRTKPLSGIVRRYAIAEIVDMNK